VISLRGCRKDDILRILSGGVLIISTDVGLEERESIASYPID
jgi:hypothetical protein